MILISHRGNLNGPNKQKENSIPYITEALQAGYSVEVDVWHTDGQFWLGHDKPQHKINIEFLTNECLWCHAKNLEALVQMQKQKIHYFWHDNDLVTLTSKNYIWAYPGVVCSNSIAVLPEVANYNPQNHLGVCSDFIESYKTRQLKVDIEVTSL